MMSQLPYEWVAALDNQFDLATDPEAHSAKLVRMAFECRRRREVDDLQLSEMLEMADAAGSSAWASTRRCTRAACSGITSHCPIGADRSSRQWEKLRLWKGRRAVGRTPEEGGLAV